MKVRTVEDIVQFDVSDSHLVTEAHYSLIHAMSGPQTLRGRHPTLL
jgi:hypothetical protein